MRVFDGHCDTLSRCLRTKESFANARGHWSVDKVKAFTSCAQFFAAFGGWEPRPNVSLYPMFQAQEALLKRQLRENADTMALCVTADQCRQVWDRGRVAAFFSVEGAELLDCEVEKLYIAAKQGVRAINLTWNFPNALSGTNCAQSDRGLSAQGRDFVREMNALGVLVDVSHLSDPGFWDVVKTTQSPIIASHSNSRTVHFHPRNLTDDQFTAIMELQGTVGLNLAADFLPGAPVLDDVVRVLEHFLDLGGEDTVALGGDWDGIERMPAELSDVTGWVLFYQRLQERGYGQELLDKLFYKNLMRVVEQVCIM